MTTSHFSDSTTKALPSLGDRAASDLGFIRAAMASSGRFTPVSGWGGVFMGVVALVAAVTSNGLAYEGQWLWTWLASATVALVGGGWALNRKANREGLPLWGEVGRKFLLGLTPPLLAGGVLTFMLWQAGLADLLPATWLLLYGTANVTGGAFSAPVIPITGAVFMLLGLITAIAPVEWGTALLGIGFGGLHIVFGLWIVRRHGG